MFSTAKCTLSELALAAVFFMQQKNGVSVMQIAEYVGEKRQCNPRKICGSIKSVLIKAKEQGILCESEGLYRIEPKYEDKLDKKELKPKKVDEFDGFGCGTPNGECVAFDIDGSKGNTSGCFQGVDLKCPAQNEQWEEYDDDDDADEGSCSDDLNPVEEPLPKKRKMSDRTHEYRCSDDDEGEEWAKCPEKKHWNVAKRI